MKEMDSHYVIFPEQGEWFEIPFQGDHFDGCIEFKLLNRSVPDSLICVSTRLRRIGAFWPLRRDCIKLRHRRMSWIVSKGQAFIFLSEIEAELSFKSHVLSQFKNSKA